MSRMSSLGVHDSTLATIKCLSFLAHDRAQEIFSEPLILEPYTSEITAPGMKSYQGRYWPSSYVTL